MPEIPSQTSVSNEHPHAGVEPLLQPLELPEVRRYHIRRLALLPRGPSAMLAIWSVADSDRPRLGAPVKMELFDVTRGERLVRSEVITGEGGRFFFDRLLPDRHYRAHILLADGSILVTSRPLTLPPEQPSRVTTEVRVRIPWDQDLTSFPRDLRTLAAADELPPQPSASELDWAEATRKDTPVDTAPVRVSTPRPDSWASSKQTALFSSFSLFLE